MLERELEGRVALVTGANHGIGAATAVALAARGARVFISYYRGGQNEPEEISRGLQEEPGPARYRALAAQPADQVMQQIREAGGTVAAMEIDLAEPTNVSRLFDQVEATLGPVEILVNNAARSATDTFRVLEPGEQDWAGRALTRLDARSHDWHFAINSRAVALMMAEFAARHVGRGARWGRIINVSTDGAYAFPGELSYGASKLAMESYSRAAALELGPYGITVNIVSPGPTQTGWLPREAEQAMAAESPLGRVGQPEDIADAILLLVSEQARWLTGQTLHAGGGHRM